MPKDKYLLNRSAFIVHMAIRFFFGIRKNLFSSYITFVAVFALALSVSIIIVVLGVINGFEKEVSNNTIAIGGHAILFPKSPKSGWQERYSLFEKHNNVESVRSFIRAGALISYGNKTFPITLEGLSSEKKQSAFSSHYPDLSIVNTISENGYEVLLGDRLADRLGIKDGQNATVLIPQLRNGRTLDIKTAQINVRGVFTVGLYDIDNKLVLTSFQAAKMILKDSDSLEGFRLTYKDARKSDNQTRALLANLKEEYDALDWSEYNRNFFLALKSQKRILFVILSLVIAVAAFNIAASILLIIENKRAEIIILLAIGCSKHSIAAIFLMIGALVSLTGSLFGLLMAFLLSRSINPLIGLAESFFSIRLLDPAIYSIDHLPIALQYTDVLITIITSSTLCLLAAIGPAYKSTGRLMIRA